MQELENYNKDPILENEWQFLSTLLHGKKEAIQQIVHMYNVNKFKIPPELEEDINRFNKYSPKIYDSVFYKNPKYMSEDSIHWIRSIIKDFSESVPKRKYTDYFYSSQFNGMTQAQWEQSTKNYVELLQLIDFKISLFKTDLENSSMPFEPYFYN